MFTLKRFFKNNSHSALFKGLAGFGRALNRFYENRNHDIYSNGELTVLKKISKFKPSVVFDGGANIGTYSILINQLIPETHIYAFEPLNSTFEKLKNNVQGINNIIPVNKGLFKESCTNEINTYPSNEHSSLYLVKGQKPTGKQTIELIRGDDFIKDQGIENIDFLKIDIEGAEYNALLGFEQSIREGKIKVIQFEYGYLNILTKRLLIDFYDLLEGHGYIVGKIFPKIVEFRKYELKHEDFLGPNFIAVKKSEQELINALQHK